MRYVRNPPGVWWFFPIKHQEAQHPHQSIADASRFEGSQPSVRPRTLKVLIVATIHASAETSYTYRSNRGNGNSWLRHSFTTAVDVESQQATEEETPEGEGEYGQIRTVPLRGLGVVVTGCRPQSRCCNTGERT